MPDREYGGGSYNSGYGGAANVGSNPRAGDTPGFDSGGGGGGQTGGFDDRRGGGTADWQSQGRGSNVTSAQPMSPAEVAGGLGPGASSFFNNPTIIPGGQGSQMYFPGGQQPTIGIPQGGSPFFSLFSGSTILPTTVGTPSILLTQQGSPALPLPPGPLRSEQANVPPVDLPTRGVAAFNEFRPITPTQISTISPGTQSIPGYQAPQPYSGPHGRTMTDQERWAGGGVFNNLESLYNLPEGTLGKIMKTESTYGNDPSAYRLTSGPSGPFQISESTGKALGVVGLGFDYRLDPVESAAAAAKYSAQISDALRSTVGRTPTTGEIGLGYQQGIGGAKALLNNPNLSAKEALSKALKGDVEEAARRIKANGGDPDAPASQFTSQKISQYGGGQANPPALTAGLDKLMASLTGTTSDVVKAALSAPAKFADTLESLLTTPAQAQAPVQNVPVPSPVQRTYREAGSPADVYTGVPASGRQEDLGVTVSDGGAQTAAQAASSSPQTFGSWLSGLFDTSGRISELEAKGRTALFPDQYSREQLVDEENNSISPKEWYRQDMERQLGRPVNESEIKSRIVDYGQGQQVDYYMKDLMSAITGGQKDNTAFPQRDTASQVTNQTAGQAASSNPDSFYNWLASQFNQPERRDFGPYGNLTIEEYRRLYGR